MHGRSAWAPVLFRKATGEEQGMKKLLWGLSLLLMAAAVQAQAAHQVTLTWTASKDSTTASPGTVSVYRAVGACPASGIGTLTYTALTSTAPAAGPYIDTTV